MTPTLQKRFEFEQELCPRRPLLTLGTAMGWLDRDEDAITYLAEDGQLVAINIAREGSRRRELRIWRDSLLAFLLRAKGHQVQITEFNSAAIIEHHRPTLRATEIKRLLNCSQALVAGLIEDGTLRATNIPEVRCGPNCSATVDRGSFERFLASRRNI